MAELFDSFVVDSRDGQYPACRSETTLFCVVGKFGEEDALETGTETGEVYAKPLVKDCQA